jgi:VanZ family protein
MSYSIKDWIWRWCPACLMMTLIFMASGTQGQDLPQFGFLDLIVKKSGHAFGYALLGISYLRGLTKGRTASPVQLILAMILASLYAVTDEFHQRFTPGRSPSLEDIIIDTIGATAGVALWPRVRARLPNRSSKPS